MASQRQSIRFESYGGSVHHRLMDRQGLGHVQLADTNQETLFVSLMGRSMAPSRCIDHAALEALGLAKGIKTLLQTSKCSGVFSICEHSYRCITLEFLATFTYNEAKKKIKFRLFNTDQVMTLKEWGIMLGCGYKGERNVYSPRDGTDYLYKLLTGRVRSEEDPTVWKFRAGYIHHPLLRLWCRLVSNIYFARPETNNLKTNEIQMLFCLLNADGGDHFEVNVAHHIAKHFEQVQSGQIGPIWVGGLVTHIAKSLFDNVDEVQLTLAPGDSIGAPLTLSLTYLARMQAVRRIQGTSSWWWKIGTAEVLRLPTDELVPIFRMPPTNFDDIDQSYYLIREDNEPHDNNDEDNDDDNPHYDVRLISPPHDYGRYRHEPFNMSSFLPLGNDPSTLPPSYASYPQFAEPEVWNSNSRDSMLFGMCNQMNQAHNNLSLAAHNMLSYHQSQGHFPDNTSHPEFFNPNPEQPTGSRHSSASLLDRHSAGGIRANSGRHSVSNHSNHSHQSSRARHSSASSSDATWRATGSEARSSSYQPSSLQPSRNLGSSSRGPSLHSVVPSASPPRRKRSIWQKIGDKLSRSSSSYKSGSHHASQYVVQPTPQPRQPPQPTPQPQQLTREAIERKIQNNERINDAEYAFMAASSHGGEYYSDDPMDEDSVIPDSSLGHDTVISATSSRSHTATSSQSRYNRGTPPHSSRY